MPRFPKYDLEQRRKVYCLYFNVILSDSHFFNIHANENIVVWKQETEQQSQTWQIHPCFSLLPYNVKLLWLYILVTFFVWYYYNLFESVIFPENSYCAIKDIELKTNNRQIMLTNGRARGWMEKEKEKLNSYNNSCF